MYCTLRPTEFNKYPYIRNHERRSKKSSGHEIIDPRMAMVSVFYFNYIPCTCFAQISHSKQRVVGGMNEKLRM